MSTPKELKYTKEHEWVSVDSDIATIGITEKNYRGPYSCELFRESIIIIATLVTMYNNDSRSSLAAFWTLDFRPSNILTMIS